MKKEPKQLSVSAIQNGTVIDHIPARHLFKVIQILGLDKIEQQITFGTNLESKKLGKKAIIKISEKFFADDDINRIALVAPDAKLNIIRDYEVIEKKVVEVPDTIVGIARCMNPKCITNFEPVTTRFRVVSKKNVSLKCHYCEKITNQENLQII
jgi:aspartate carbamoyltransferase regulatory subunit